MASQAINHIADSDQGDKETTAITVGSSEKIAVRLSRSDKGCTCKLKISGNSVITYETIDETHTLFDSIPSGHEVSVITNRMNSSGGVEGVIESYT